MTSQMGNVGVENVGETKPFALREFPRRDWKANEGQVSRSSQMRSSAKSLAVAEYLGNFCLA